MVAALLSLLLLLTLPLSDACKKKMQIFCILFSLFITESSIEPSVMKPDQERVKTLLADTVTLLCRNGLHFQRQLRVQGVLGITVDDTDVFIVHINESFTDQGRGTRLADFQGPLGSGFTAQLVATLSGQPTVNSVTTGQQAINPLPKWQAQQKHKAADAVDACQLNAAAAMKRAKVDMQYANIVQESKDIIKDNQSSQQQATVALPVSAAVAAQWQFDTVQKIQQQTQRTTVTAETPCYLSYSAGSSVVANSVSVSKRKANVYPPPQAMLAMSFGGLTSSVDYGNSMLQSGTLQQPGRDLCSTNSVHTSSSTNKLWNDSAGQLAVQQQQQLANDEQRLSATPVFDPLTGCTTWTVQHLVDGQGLHQMKAEDQQQSTLDVVSAVKSALVRLEVFLV